MRSRCIGHHGSVGPYGWRGFSFRVGVSLLALACLVVPRVQAREKPELLPPGIESLETLARVPILYNGRKMPIDSYARNVLLQLSGRRSMQGAPAMEWLAQVLFDARASVDHPLFLIEHPDVLQALEMEEHERGRYSFAQLHGKGARLRELAIQASELADEDRSLVEQELMRLHGNVMYYLDLFHAVQFAVPDSRFTIEVDSLKTAMGLEGVEEVCFLDVFGNVAPIRDQIEGLAEKPPEEWTDEEKESFRLSSLLYGLSKEFSGSRATFLPVDPHGEEVWLAPWDTLRMSIQDAGVQNAIQQLAGMQRAYTAGDQAAFDTAASSYGQFVLSRMFTDRATRLMDLEVRYNQLKPFFYSGLLYGFGFFFGFLFFITDSRWCSRIAWWLTVAAFVPHLGGIITRMVIMGRPPITNLYATFLFVALVCVILGWVVEAFQKSGLGLLTSGFGGLALLMIAGRFFNDGDTMGKVVAVLSSNFWLSTHVVAITIGYAGCVFAGLIGHVYLLHAIFAPGRTERMDAMHRALFGMLGFGLIFSFLGTMLGGVWADQSWGRFWGWDPKENGALLIVLWCAVLIHARLTGWIQQRGMAAGCVIGVIFVTIAWLGVNLLSVGMHSYGFTSGLAGLFYGIIGFELLFVLVTVPLARVR